MSEFWPGTKILRSTGNGFDLTGRTHSIFFDPKRSNPPPPPSGKFGKRAASQVETVQGLSQRARDQLSDAPNAITIGTRADSDKRLKNRKAAI